jgi:hypothetical protein
MQRQQLIIWMAEDEQPVQCDSVKQVLNLP